MNLKKVQCRWHRFPSTTLPRVGSYRHQPWAIKSTSPTGLILPTTIRTRGLTSFARINHQTETRRPCTIHSPNETNHSTHNLPKQNNHLHVIHPNEINHLHTIHPNKTVGAVPACPPERPRSGVSIITTHASCARNERRMRPCRATRAGTQAPPLPIPIIFFHATPHTQNNHLRVIHPNNINRPHAICPNETVGAVPACPPERPRSGVSIPRIHGITCGNERWMRPYGATRAGT